MTQRGLADLGEDMNSDIVIRLRDKAAKGGVIPIHDMTIEEAADTIERLRVALEQIANWYEPGSPSHYELIARFALTGSIETKPR